MAVTSITRNKERRSNHGNASRFLKIADELEQGIKKMRELQLKCVYTDMESGHLEAQIQIFTDTMNEYRGNAIKIRGEA